MAKVETSVANDTKTDGDIMNSKIFDVTAAQLNATTKGGLPVFGYPGATFYAIHIVALVSLIVSILVSFGVLIFLCHSRLAKHFFDRPIGERLVVYLALVDLAFSISHVMDHAYMLADVDHPPDSVCMGFAFMVQGFLVAQGLIVLYTAIGAFLLVVLEKKIDLGRCDWKLILVALGIPALIGVAGSIVPFLGPSGPWWVDYTEH